MKTEFIPYQEALELKNLGFDEPCLCFYSEEKFNDNYSILHPVSQRPQKELDFHYNHLGSLISAPLYQQAFRWFRERYDLHVQIRRENYFHISKYEYYHFDISREMETDITNQEELLEEIFNESSQDIPSNYLNDEKYSKLIFERNFAFKTYEEIELACLRKLIEIVKKQKL